MDVMEIGQKSAGFSGFDVLARRVVLADCHTELDSP